MKTEERPQPAWPLPMRTISASSLATFARCAEQFRRRYILGERERPAASSVLGHAVHGSAEVNYAQKTTSGVDLSIPDVQLAYAERFDKEVDELGGPGEVDWGIKVGRERRKVTPAKAKDIGLPLAQTYREKVSPSVTPIASEEWFETEVPGVPAPLVGKIDLITDTHKVDLKFGATARGKPDTSWKVQAMIYMLADRTDNLAGINRLDFQWHTGSWGSERYGPKIWTPDLAPDLTLPRTSLATTIASAHVRSIVAAMVTYYERFGPDEPWPGTGLGHTWACDFCGWRPTCYWWVGPREEVLTLL